MVADIATYLDAEENCLADSTAQPTVAEAETPMESRVVTAEEEKLLNDQIVSAMAEEYYGGKGGAEVYLWQDDEEDQSLQNREKLCRVFADVDNSGAIHTIIYAFLIIVKLL